MWIAFDKQDRFGHGVKQTFLPVSMDDIMFECSECGVIEKKATEFCPQCGCQHVIDKTVKLNVRKRKRKRGIWIVFDIFDPTISNDNKAKCSECGEIFQNVTHFCPHCGASMKDER